MQKSLAWHPRQMNNELDARALTSLIKDCRDWQQLRDVCLQHHKLFNSIHLAAAITHLAQIQPIYSNLNSRTRSGSLASTSDYGEAFRAPGSRRRIRTSEMSKASMLSNLTGSSTLLDQLLQHSLKHPERFSLRQISNMVWAIARLSVPQCPLPLDSNVALFLKVAVQASLSQKGPSTPQHLANFAYGLALLKTDPGRVWINSLMNESLMSMESFKPFELVIFVFALNKILLQHYALDSSLHKKLAALILSVISTTRHQMSELTGKELSSIALSLSSLSRLAECEAQLMKSDWMHILLLSARNRLNAGDYNSQCITCTLLACSSLSKYEAIQAYQDMLSSFLRQVTMASQQSLSHWSILALASTLNSLSRLNFSPGESWMLSFEQAVLGQLTRVLQESRAAEPRSLSRHLGTIISGMAKVQWVPSLMFVSTFLTCCSFAALRDQSEINQIILSLKKIGVVCNELPSLNWDRAKRELSSNSS